MGSIRTNFNHIRLNNAACSAEENIKLTHTTKYDIWTCNLVTQQEYKIDILDGPKINGSIC